MFKNIPLDIEKVRVVETVVVSDASGRLIGLEPGAGVEPATY
jgi:hypothetical protein